jgi:glycosyltransferase involved in cell wall biosynthesis
MEQRRAKIVVLGNGPSLRGFDFATLDAVDSLGMNAAYRYWDRVGWYPTHYACLDDQLIETHADAIYRLIISGQVRTAFLISKILAYHPDLSGRDNVFFLESFNRQRQRRLADERVPFIESIPFAESDPSKVTTGAYAVRYAAHLGYREVAILGVDLRYVEIIPEARQTEGIKLVVDRTPESNPNYFFDDYQRAGDKYNVPNPAAHGRNLHVAAFEALAHDIVAYRWPTRVFNANPQSALQEQGILPFVDIRRFAPGRALGAVVVPTTRREEQQLLLNLQIWDQPAFAPCTGTPPARRPDLVVAFSGVQDDDLRRRICAAYEATDHLKRCFERLDVCFVGLDVSLDYYERDYTLPVPGKGHKSGPNEQFFELVTTMSDRGDFVFYMEADCVPLRQGWLDEVGAIAAADQGSWVIGSVYRGIGELDPRFSMHLNGNALYRVGDPTFQAFARNYWRPTLHRVVEREDRRMAYDCVLSYVFSEANPEVGNDAWKDYQRVAGRFRASDFIQDHSGAADQKANPLPVVKALLADSPATVLAHGQHFARCVHDAWRRAVHAVGSAPFSWARILESSLPVSVPAAATRLQRLLVIDSTVIGSSSATGQIKQLFLDGWSPEGLLQVHEAADGLGLWRPAAARGKQDEPAPRSDAELLQACLVFAPEVVYFRPVDSPRLFEATLRILEATKCPLVIHIMDDWPERLRVEAPERYARLDPLLRHLLRQARVRLAIGSKMAEAYRERYGCAFDVLANGVDLTVVPERDWEQRPPVDAQHPFVLRYMGGLAQDMTRDSVLDVARAVSELSQTMPLRFEIHTMNWYLEDARQAVRGLHSVSVSGLVPVNDYWSHLASADALLMAYNFDEATQRYAGLSLANKLPECLATGNPLLAYGPQHMATIACLREAGCASVVDQRDGADLRQALSRLVQDRIYCREIGTAGRRFVARHHRRVDVVERFRRAVADAARSRLPALVTGQALPRARACIVRAQGDRHTSRQFSFVSSPLGRSFVAFVSLRSPCSETVLIQLRDPATGLNRVRERHELAADQRQDIRLCFTADAAIEQIELQIGPADPQRGDRGWHLLEADIQESIESVVAHWPAADLSLQQANALHRDGDLATALRLYLHLYLTKPLPLYARSAVTTAALLGLAGSGSIEQILQRTAMSPRAVPPFSPSPSLATP